MAVQNTNGEIVKEIKELKALINDVKTKQSDMEKALLKISKRLDMKDFDLAKSTHAVSAPLLKYCFTVTCNKYKFCLNVYICIYMNFVSGKCYQNMCQSIYSAWAVHKSKCK